MRKRNTANDGWDNLYPITQATNVKMTDGKTVEAKMADHGNHVPAKEAASNKKFLRNDNTWQEITPANIGAATPSDIPGTLPANGGDANTVGGKTVEEIIAAAGTGVFTQSLAPNGWTKLPNGLIFQWGTTPGSTNSSTLKTVTFPIAFPNACFGVTLGLDNM